jgi:C4-dicarboxylate transporter DctQ subunit
MIISHIVTLIFLAAVSWYGYEYLLLVIDLDERSIDLEIPMWIPYLVIPLAFASAALRVAQRLKEIIVTPAEKIVSRSEAQMILAEMEEALDEKSLKEIEKRTGGML